MPYREVSYRLQSTTRKDIRVEITNLFLEEEPGTGTGNLASNYCYVVDSYGDYCIKLHRPAYLNKGFDFAVHVHNIEFEYARIRTEPTHDDIISCLGYVKNHYSSYKYNIVRQKIEDIFYCCEIDVFETDGMYFLDHNGYEKPVGILLLAIKWLFIEQDITYWNFSGRNMLMNGLMKAGLA